MPMDLCTLHAQSRIRPLCHLFAMLCRCWVALHRRIPYGQYVREESVRNKTQDKTDLDLEASVEHIFSVDGRAVKNPKRLGWSKFAKKVGLKLAE